MLIASSTPAQNLFVSDFSSGNIYEYTPDGVRSTFASGLRGPCGLAFNSEGDLFVVNGLSNYIIKITPSGTQSTFASGLSTPYAAAIDSADNLFVSVSISGRTSRGIIKFTPDGVKSLFASGLGNQMIGLAFQPVPEPSALGLLAVGVFGIALLRRHRG